MSSKSSSAKPSLQRYRRPSGRDSTIMAAPLCQEWMTPSPTSQTFFTSIVDGLPITSNSTVWGAVSCQNTMPPVPSKDSPLNTKLPLQFKATPCRHSPLHSSKTKRNLFAPSSGKSSPIIRVFPLYTMGLPLDLMNIGSKDGIASYLLAFSLGQCVRVRRAKQVAHRTAPRPAAAACDEVPCFQVRRSLD